MKQSSFALVYVLVFTMMILTIVTMISGALVTNIKLQRSSQSSIQAYNLARSAIDVGWGKYKDDLAAKEAASPDGITFDFLATDSTFANFLTRFYSSSQYKITYLQVQYPAPVGIHTVCDTANWATHRMYIKADGTTDEEDHYYGDSDSGINDFTTYPNGVYDYSICYDGTHNFIRTVGYYRGTKVAMKATITHQIPNDTNYPRDMFYADFQRFENGGIVGGVQQCTPVTGQCGNDSAVTGLSSCSLSSPLPPSPCDTKNHLTDIRFNHTFDKLNISQQ